MKKIFLQKCLYSTIFAAYFNFINSVLTQNIYEKKIIYKAKGVGQKSFSTSIVSNFDCLCGRISEKIHCSVKYEERSKRLTVTFRAETPNSFLNLLEALKKASFCLLTSYLHELVWGLIEVIFDVEDINIKSFNYFVVPKINIDFKYVNPFLILKNRIPNKYFTDDVFCILYNIFIRRNNPFSFIKISADDILFLRGIKKISTSYKKEDKKRISAAICALNALNLIRATKIKRYVWKVFVLPNFLPDIYFVPREIFCLNPRTKYFEKYLAHLICSQIHHSKDFIKLKEPIEFLYKNIKYLKPSFAREKIENAFDELVKIKIIKNWEYKNIDENKLTGADWILKYKRLKIVFNIKNRECALNVNSRF